MPATRFVEFAYRAAGLTTIIGAVLAVFGVHSDGETSRFWVVLGTWLALVGSVAACWVGRIRDRQTNSPRRLSKAQSEALRSFLMSDLFRIEPKVTLRVGAVSDSEAQMYAMELQNFFSSCGVNIYPTNGGLPNECVQVAPNPDGLTLSVRNIEPANQAFARLERCLVKIGMKVRVEAHPERLENEAMLYVLKKPA